MLSLSLNQAGLVNANCNDWAFHINGCEVNVAILNGIADDLIDIKFLCDLLCNAADQARGRDASSSVGACGVVNGIYHWWVPVECCLQLSFDLLKIAAVLVSGGVSY